MEAALRRSRGESSGHEQGYKEGIVTKVKLFSLSLQFCYYSLLLQFVITV